MYSYVTWNKYGRMYLVRYLKVLYLSGSLACLNRLTCKNLNLHRLLIWGISLCRPS